MKSGPLHFTLIAAAALSAFTLKPAAQGAREQLGLIFVPVSAPARAMGQWVLGRLSPQKQEDLLSPGKARTPEELQRQNALLVVQVQNLQAQVEDLKRISAEYRQLQDLQKLVEPATILQWPAQNRQTLSISTAGLSNVRERMAVLHPFGFAGSVHSVAPVGGAARVLLTTDVESRVEGRFARTSTGDDGKVVTTFLPLEPIMITGDGQGQLVATMLAARSIRQHVRVGDIVLVDDPTFGPAVKGLRLGVVTDVQLPPTDAGHAAVRIDPRTDFARLREVLVLTKWRSGQ